MQIVVREADRLSGLIQDFLQYAQPRPPKLESVPLGPLVEDVLRLFESARPKGVQIEVVGDGSLAANADPAQLRQVVWNLLLNAAQAVAGQEKERAEGAPGGEGQGVIRVVIEASPGASRAAPEGPQQHATQAQQSADRNEEQAAPSRARSALSLASVAGGWVELSIADTGCGISAEAQEQIFEPFFTTRTEGSGLGLSTVHRIVESHGGELQVESQEGEGTTFRVRLPRGEHAAADAGKETEA
jgi:two-component system sensor histidine kinase PilS (NtrC family)